MTDKLNERTEHKNYQQAWQEWESRIGSAKTQASNWRLACILSLLITVLLLVGIYRLLDAQKRYVYVAEVAPSDNVMNVQAVAETVQPNQSQETYTVGRFISSIMSLPLDPVVARNQWLYAYNLVSGRAVQQLNDFAAKSRPFAQLGEQSKTVTIKNFNAIGNHSYEFTWVQTVYNQNGAVTSSTLYSGIFTVSAGGAPGTVQDLLENPFGIKIAYFTFSVEGH